MVELKQLEPMPIRLKKAEIGLDIRDLTAEQVESTVTYEGTWRRRRGRDLL